MPFNAHAAKPVLSAEAAAWVLGYAALATAASPQGAAELKQTLARTGVFFRADAPYVLRNPADPFLPVSIEIINGVEKTGRSAISRVAPYVTREPLQFEGVDVFAKPSGARRKFADEPLSSASGDAFTFDARSNGQPLPVAARWRKTLQIPRQQLADYLRQHYLGALPDTVDLMISIRLGGWPPQNTFLRVRVNAPPLPELPGWYRGDMHYHSAYTDNPAERGHPLHATKQAALATGLRWVVLADHSTELNPETYAQALQEIRQLNDGRMVFIRGEEITAASAKEGMLTTIHLVALPSAEDPEKGFPAGAGDVIMAGDGSVASPAVPLREALSRIATAGGFAYAAHPFDPISPILRGGAWDLAADFLAPGGKQLPPGLVGLEPWNRATTLTADNARDPYCIQPASDPAACFQPDPDANHYARLEKGIELGWKPLLQQMLAATGDESDAPPFKVFLAAGSDAHGDFNYEATMDAVDFLSKPARGLSGYAEDNAFGKLATVVYCPQGMGSRGENVLRALRNGQSVLSNGPLLVAGFDLDRDGNLGGEADIMPGGHAAWARSSVPPLQLSWASSEEFGPLKSLRLVLGTAGGEAGAREIPLPAGKELDSAGLVAVDLRPFLLSNPPGWGYIRMEGRSRNAAGEEFRCYTNPVWVRLLEQ